MQIYNAVVAYLSLLVCLEAKQGWSGPDPRMGDHITKHLMAGVGVLAPVSWTNSQRGHESSLVALKVFIWFYLSLIIFSHLILIGLFHCFFLPVCGERSGSTHVHSPRNLEKPFVNTTHDYRATVLLMRCTGGCIVMPSLCACVCGLRPGREAEGR